MRDLGTINYEVNGLTPKCSTCRWQRHYGHTCSHPLIGKDMPHVDWQISKHMWPSRNWPTVKLCGVEKLLWEPRWRWDGWFIEHYGSYGRWIPVAGFIAWLTICVGAM